MKQLFGILFLIALVTGCSKDKTPTPEPIPAPTKWELVPGHYKVYDSTGVFIYEMDIEHTSGTNIYGATVDTLHFINFDGQFDLTVTQASPTNFPDMITTGSETAILDSINNRWDLFCYSPDPVYNNFRNDTIMFYFQKQNMPYWLNDATPYFNANLKHIAVKQK